MKHSKIVIIGSGPAGYTAALYAARANLAPILFEGFYTGEPGGQLMSTTEVENFPGFPEGITGPELMHKFKAQAERFGTLLVTDDVTKINFNSRPFEIHSSVLSCTADSIIIATGATAKRLPIPGTNDDQFWQKGVTACAVCDGAMPIFRNRPLFVIGGGDSACEEALFLTKYGSKVYLVHRRDQLRASKIMAERALRHPKIEPIWDSEVINVGGTDVVQNVTIKNLKTGQESHHEAGGVFFAVGHQPNTSFLGGAIELHDNGYVKVKSGTCQTNIEGVFAAGDCQDFTYRQAITAAGSGCMASLEAERWLSSKDIH